MGEREEYTGEREYDTENGSSRTGHRKRKNKPLLEKRRRARINESLVQLKSLVLESVQHDAAQYSKLEKADILEMTVSHLMQLQKQHVSACAHMVGMLSKFRVGYNECTHEVVRYLSEDMDGVAPEVRTRLLNHLVSCIETTNVTRVAGHDKIAVMNNIQVDMNNYPYQRRNHNQIRTSLKEKCGLMNNEGCRTKLNIPVTPRKASQNHDLQLKTNYSENEIKIPKTEFPSLQFIQLSDESNRLQIHPKQKPSKLNAGEAACLSAQTKVNQKHHPHHQMQMNPNTFTAHDGSYDSLLMAVPNGTNADKITTWDSIVPSMDFSLRERTCVTQFNGRERYKQCSPPSFDRRDKNNNHAHNSRASMAFKPNNRTYTNVNMTGSRLEDWPCVNLSPEKLNFHINCDFPKPETRHQDVVSAATIEEMAPNIFANASNNVWRPW